MLSKKQLVLAVIIILAVLACLTAYMIVNSQQDNYGTLKLSSSCSVSVPLVENNVESVNKDIMNYSFNKNDLNIIYQKSINDTEIKSLNEKQVSKAQLTEDNIYYDKSTGIYSAFIENNDTSDSIIITCKDLNLLKKIKNSVKFSKQTKNLNTTNTSNNTTNNEVVNTGNDETTDTASPTTEGNYENNNYYEEYNYYISGESSSDSPNTQKEEKEVVVEKGYNDVIRF